MRANSSIILSTAIFEVPGLPLPVQLRRMQTARIMRLRVDHGKRLLKLTAPARTTPRQALHWAEQQRHWVDAQLAEAPPLRSFADGATIPLSGRDVTIRWLGGRRGVRLDQDKLLVGGPQDSLGRSLSRWLQDEARRALSAETARIAAAAGVTVRRVSIGDPASRWGSCSSSGNIRYSWRLILAPPECLRFVVAHEVAHRLHMNHGPEFKRLEAELFGGPVTGVRHLLRRWSPVLRAVGG